MKRKVIFIVFAAVLAFDLLAHPHIFIKPTLQFLVKGKTITGIKVDWEWDQWWSSDVIYECDFNKDGKFSQNEIDYIFKNFFNEVRNFDYFMKLKIDKKSYRIKKVENFSARISGKDKVNYYFTIPLNIPCNGDASIWVAFNDDTIFTAFEKTIKLIPSSGFSYSNQSNSVEGYYGVKSTFKINFE